MKINKFTPDQVRKLNEQLANGVPYMDKVSPVGARVINQTKFKADMLSRTLAEAKQYVGRTFKA